MTMAGPSEQWTDRVETLEKEFHQIKLLLSRLENKEYGVKHNSSAFTICDFKEERPSQHQQHIMKESVIDGNIPFNI